MKELELKDEINKMCSILTDENKTADYKSLLDFEYKLINGEGYFNTATLYQQKFFEYFMALAIKFGDEANKKRVADFAEVDKMETGEEKKYYEMAVAVYERGLEEYEKAFEIYEKWQPDTLKENSYLIVCPQNIYSENNIENVRCLFYRISKIIEQERNSKSINGTLSKDDEIASIKKQIDYLDKFTSIYEQIMYINDFFFKSKAYNLLVDITPLIIGYATKAYADKTALLQKVIDKSGANDEELSNKIKQTKLRLKKVYKTFENADTSKIDKECLKDIFNSLFNLTWDEEEILDIYNTVENKLSEKAKDFVPFLIKKYLQGSSFKYEQILYRRTICNSDYDKNGFIEASAKTLAEIILNTPDKNMQMKAYEMARNFGLLKTMESKKNGDFNEQLFTFIMLNIDKQEAKIEAYTALKNHEFTDEQIWQNLTKLAKENNMIEDDILKNDKILTAALLCNTDLNAVENLLNRREKLKSLKMEFFTNLLSNLCDEEFVWTICNYVFERQKSRIDSLTDEEKEKNYLFCETALKLVQDQEIRKKIIIKKRLFGRAPKCQQNCNQKTK